MEWYGTLFDKAVDSDIIGEAGTHYTKLLVFDWWVYFVYNSYIQIIHAYLVEKI